MSRPLRFQGSGLMYHVMARGNNKMRIFLDDLDSAQFTDIVREMRRRYAVDLWVYCLMPNHFHLVLRTRQPNLSRAIAYLNGVYASWWNKRHARVGHVYQGRFKAQVVEGCHYLLRLCRYVLMNPVRSELVAHPWDWKWSSYQALAEAQTSWIDVETLVRAIDPDGDPSVRARLLEFVDNYSDEEMSMFLRRDRRVIGSEAFARRFAAEARQASTQVPARERRIGTAPLPTLLARALERGDGLHAGVMDAYGAHYRLQEIAGCAGLSVRVVSRLVKATTPRRPGPRLAHSQS